eukprot:CAMPEP_0170191686 /NCGR_PEP_ID=MMETSP0040_2-20121228/52303_1 /TAXON_ID=641309 /ORGANISM="Lotharella oceanica, Strain CCMP622" /LENGTH=91 /DNA_ID=CAMNT_0010439835 /DNA_START=165 /DNA_END=440 /DNA_ORIENTATION=+
MSLAFTCENPSFVSPVKFSPKAVTLLSGGVGGVVLPKANCPFGGKRGGGAAELLLRATSFLLLAMSSRAACRADSSVIRNTFLKSSGFPTV